MPNAQKASAVGDTLGLCFDEKGASDGNGTGKDAILVSADRRGSPERNLRRRNNGGIWGDRLKKRLSLA